MDDAVTSTVEKLDSHFLGLLSTHRVFVAEEMMRYVMRPVSEIRCENGDSVVRHCSVAVGVTLVQDSGRRRMSHENVRPVSVVARERLFAPFYESEIIGFSVPFTFDTVDLAEPSENLSHERHSRRCDCITECRICNRLQKIGKVDVIVVPRHPENRLPTQTTHNRVSFVMEPASLVADFRRGDSASLVWEEIASHENKIDVIRDCVELLVLPVEIGGMSDLHRHTIPQSFESCNQLVYMATFLLLLRQTMANTAPVATVIA